MANTLEVPIGPNAHIHAGPFDEFDGDGIEGYTDPENGILVGEDADGILHKTTPAAINRAVVAAMRDGDPVRVVTGDVDFDDVSGVGVIEVPLIRGYRASIHNLAGATWGIDTLGDKYARRNVERKLRQRGGELASRDFEA